MSADPIDGDPIDSEPIDSEPIDGERLQKLLGGAALSELRRRLRARYERATSRDEFILTHLGVHERRALAGLLGRRTLAASSMRLRRSEIDAALRDAGVAPTLRDALEFLDGPVPDRRAEQAARRQSWDAAFSATQEPRLVALVTDVAGAGLVKRLAGSDAQHAQTLLAQAARVLARLPGRGVSRAQLAADVLGDSHGLDEGRAVATLVLRACAAGRSIDTDDTDGAIETAGAAGLQDADESPRERRARLGVTVNELALPALCLNLQGLCLNLQCLSGDQAHPLGEPLHLSLRRLLRQPPAWAAAGRDVFVCENPNVVAIAADRLGPACAPLVCTDGMPSAAQQTLLAQLAAAGARLRYHGDFDWPGLVIGNFLVREFGAEPWRFAAADYLAATAEHGIALRAGKPVIAQWDPELTAAMAARGVVVHEEAVADVLMMDLGAISAV
jgi:uncharacterized protein (TIGR02679 family)